MSFSMNVHPESSDGKWESVEAQLWGRGGGNCLRIYFKEVDRQPVGFDIHFNGNKQGATELLFMLRKALDALPKTERCTCKPDCQEIILKGDLEYDS